MIVRNIVCLTIIFFIIIVIIDMTCFDWNIMIAMLDMHPCKNYILITTYYINGLMIKKKKNYA